MDLAAGFRRDPERFTDVHDRYFRDIYRYVAGRLDVQAAEDIAAETFCLAFGQRDRFDPQPMIEFTKLDYAHIQRLPTDPDRLKAALLKSSTVPKNPGQKQLTTINLLQTVLAEAPAPPKVRAAAYRALAALPNIANLGRTAGGYRLKISYMNSKGTHVDGTETIVVDPKTTRLRVEGWAGFGDGGLPVGPSQSTSGWTDRLPGRIVPWSAQIPFIDEENARANGQNP